MATISSVGIGSGLDSSGIISKLVALEKAPITGLTTKANKLQTQISAFGTVQSQVAALADVATRIALPSAWTARTASSSAPTSATITATSTANATSFTLDVDQLAKQQSVSSPTLTAGTTPGAGTLKFRLGAWSSSVPPVFTNAATTLAGTAVTGYATALDAGDITINGTPLGAMLAATTAAERGKQVNDAINAVSGTTGVAATYDTITGAVTLSSASGNDIVLATATSAKSTTTGLGTSGTVSGDVSVAVTATDTVTTIAAKINTAGAGVMATAFNDGSNDRLLLRSKNTGTAAGFRVQSDDAALAQFVFDPQNKAGVGMDADHTGSPVTYAVDAKARINGLAVTSGSNTLIGNIPGVTIKLVATTTTNYGNVGTEARNPATMTVSEDVTPAVRNVSDLVTAYNNLNATLSDLTAFKWDATLQKRVSQPFQGDASVVGLINMMRSLVGSASRGATSQYLSDVGLQLGKDGSLSINNAKLTVAANDGNSMQKLFTNDNGDPLTNGFALKFKALGKGLLAAGSSGTKGVQPGQGVVTAKAAKLQSDLDINAAAQKKVTDHATDVEAMLTKRYSALDGQMGSLTALGNYVSQQVTLWNKNTA